MLAVGRALSAENWLQIAALDGRRIQILTLQSSIERRFRILASLFAAYRTSCMRDLVRSRKLPASLWKVATDHILYALQCAQLPTMACGYHAHAVSLGLGAVRATQQVVETGVWP